ncbi:MRG/MORF4L-binding protein isoform X2 [Engraulis encrasicolus]|uniref:MRG/MORF4L-binding protein isoform X2 n=1 Tax=Engraulis encrasicolus TaxID=184585 RepID=UPI002FD732C3
MGEAEAIPADEKQADSGLGPTDESVIWNQEVEVCLFHAMLGHKPVGVNRHFHMICIRDKFSQNLGRQVSSKVIWEHLSTMYDMQALHESEILPFPNSEKAFALPDEIIQDVKEGGKPRSEDDVKEEFKEENEPTAVHEEGLGPSMAGQDIERQQLFLDEDSDREAERPGEGGGARAAREGPG